MNVREKVAVVNRAKIVATLGPAVASASSVRELLLGGADVARINFSHGTHDTNLELMRLWRQEAEKLRRPAALMQDLQGTKLRIGRLAGDRRELLEGSIITFLAGVEQTNNDMIPLPEPHVPQAVRRGDRLLLHDGQLEAEVLGVTGRQIMAKVILGGTLSSRQGLAVPAATWPQEDMSQKDKDDLAMGLKFGVDFVALSFVRTAADVARRKEVMAELARDAQRLPGVIVKIENQEALDNFEEILAQADGVMIARGDLGLDVAASGVPATQRDLIARCLVAGKPVVVATQLLGSMAQRPRPSRAEVSDVANAVWDYADALMLSDETAVGRYPVRSVAQMAEVIATTEAAPVKSLLPDLESQAESVPQAAAAASVQLARHVAAKAILVVTRSGYSARAVARFRWDVPIFAATDDPLVQRQLSLTWGVTALLAEGYEQPEEMSRAALKLIPNVGPGDKVVVVSGLRRPEGGFDSAIRVVEL